MRRTAGAVDRNLNRINTRPGDLAEQAPGRDNIIEKEDFLIEIKL